MEGVENLKITDVLDVCADYLDDPTKQENIDNFENMKQKLVVRKMLPLLFKEDVLTKVLASIESYGDELYGYCSALELSLTFNALMAYTNIDLMIDSALKDYGYYDLIWMSGLADYILEFCKDDYNHLKEMVYQMLNFSNLKELFSALNGVDTEALDRLTKEVNETRTHIDPSIIANLAKVVDFVDPMTATVKNSIQENIAKAVEEYKKQQKNEEKK